MRLRWVLRTALAGLVVAAIIFTVVLLLKVPGLVGPVTAVATVGLAVVAALSLAGSSETRDKP